MRHTIRIKKIPTRIFHLFAIIFLFVIDLGNINGRTPIINKLHVADEVNCLHFDNNGLLWIGTTSGIIMYNGDELKELSLSTHYASPLLSTDILSITSDENNLWIGTNNGLVRVIRNTGKIKHYQFPKQSQSLIYKLFVSSDGTLYVGTDDGFSIYNAEKDNFTNYNYDQSYAIYTNGVKDRYKGWGVKDFCEAPNGEILIGTWAQGVWRYNPKNGEIYSYKKLNWANSALTLCIDHKQQLWIGTHSVGIQRITHWNKENFDHIEHLTKDDGSLNYNQRLINDLIALPDNSVFACVGDTITGVIGPNGTLWLALGSGSIIQMKQTSHTFNNHILESTRSLMTLDGKHFFVGMGDHGYAFIDIESHNILRNKEVPGFENIPGNEYTPRITSILKRFNGEIWMAAGDNGILVSKPNGVNGIIYPNSRNLPFVKDNVNSLMEAKRDSVLWIGQRQGVSYLLPNGEGYHVDIKNETNNRTDYCIVNNIIEDNHGNIWVASANKGVIRISGNPFKKSSIQCIHPYTPCHNITSCFEDSRNIIWAISSSGLLKYDSCTNRFDYVRTSTHLTGKKILSINEDQYGAIWMTTPDGLIRMDKNGNTEYFTKEDGLLSTTFYKNATQRYGDRLFFGTDQGIIEFTPKETYYTPNKVCPPLLVMDIIIDGTSVLQLDTVETSTIIDAMPWSARQITIPANTRKFGFDFCLLTYSNQEQSQYSCLLEGYDTEWQTVSGRIHSIIYDRIPSGTYTFRLKAADNHGYWHELPYSIRVKVLAPWYAQWWALVIYFIVFCIIVYFIASYVRMCREKKASKRFSTILQSMQQVPVVNPQDTMNEGNNNITSDDNKTLPYTNSDRDNKTETDNQRITTTAREALFVSRATALVRENLTDSEYNRDRLAADLGMSISSLYNRLRDSTDMSTQVFIQTIRLNAACDILKANPDIRISELAYKVGFNTPKYFSQCFKKQFGVLPGDYINHI